MKKLKFRLILPLLPALVLVLGSCMTVFAADPLPVPDDDTYSYFVEVSQNGAPYKVFYFSSASQCAYDDSNGYIVVSQRSSYYYASYSDGAWSDLVKRPYQNYNGYVGLSKLDDGTYSVSSSNFDILYKGGDKVFFRPLLVVQARVLPGVVIKHLKTILPVGVGCLALLTGSVVLLPRLRRSLLRF